jgi:hypothetical protein
MMLGSSSTNRGLFPLDVTAYLLVVASLKSRAPAPVAG